MSTFRLQTMSDIPLDWPTQPRKRLVTDRLHSAIAVDREHALKTAQIGRCGELLVQYDLLLHGIESSAMTTDSGVDLVAYSPRIERALTIQVKTNLRPKQSGGTGHLALDWWLRQDSPAELVALVDLSTNGIWMFQHEELASAAQQRPQGRLHFYFYVEDDYRPRISKAHFTDYVPFQLANRVTELFGVMSTETGNESRVIKRLVEDRPRAPQVLTQQGRGV